MSASHLYRLAYRLARVLSLAELGVAPRHRGPSFVPPQVQAIEQHNHVQSDCDSHSRQGLLFNRQISFAASEDRGHPRWSSP
ncbi:protein of unknown function [Bradyrhizobium vignae]|uniref:Uncharacterized protein n=1 Tax=Bradyrhizobium vignae TaxID=1549949 RepID=A0A2U3PRB7_9BRAD|nr:protein of unknown function [Bradyrhizobium vignae]